MAKNKNNKSNVIPMPAAKKQTLGAKYIGPKKIEFSNGQTVNIGHIIDVSVLNDSGSISEGKSLVVSDIFGGALVLNQKSDRMKGWNNIDINRVVDIKVTGVYFTPRVNNKRVPIDKRYMRAIFQSYGSSMSKFCSSIGAGAGYLSSAKTIAVAQLAEIAKLLGVEPGVLVQFNSTPTKNSEGKYLLSFRSQHVEVDIPSFEAAFEKITVLHINEPAKAQVCLKNGNLVKIWLTDDGAVREEKLIAA